MTLIQLAVLLLWLDASNVYRLLYLASFTVDGNFPLLRDSTKELFLFVKALLQWLEVFPHGTIHGLICPTNTWKALDAHMGF